LTAAIGGALGVVGGSIAGYYANGALGRRIDPKLAELGGALVGAAIGAAIGTESDVAAAAHLCPPSRIGTSGVGELRSEWKL
jgi:hypothetical protein